MEAKKYLSAHAQCHNSVCGQLLQIINTVFALIPFFFRIMLIIIYIALQYIWLLKIIRVGDRKKKSRKCSKQLTGNPKAQKSRSKFNK